MVINPIRHDDTPPRHSNKPHGALGIIPNPSPPIPHSELLNQALTTLTEVHQTSSALEALVAVARPMLRDLEQVTGPLTPNSTSYIYALNPKPCCDGVESRVSGRNPDPQPLTLKPTGLSIYGLGFGRRCPPDAPRSRTGY